jgi:LuxR family maltose regulon positive regulatory protein
LTLIVTTMLAEALQMQARLHEAAATQRRALQLTSEQEGRPVPFAGLAYVGLSRLFYEWDDLEGALHHAQKGIELCNLGGLVEPIPAGCFILAQVHLARGDLDKAARMIRETEQSAQRYKNDYVLARAAALRTRLWLAEQDRAQEDQWAGLNLPGSDGGTDYLRELCRLARVRELIARALAARPAQGDQVSQALDLVQQVLAAATVAGRVENTIKGLVLQALALEMQGAADRALDALERALMLAEPGGYVRTFVDEGEPMARLLRRALAQGIAPGYVARLLAAFRDSVPAKPPAAQALVEPLTGRELEVLRLIAAGLSNREIAEELYIAVSTVKTHVNRIYGKLGAKSRTQAVVKAQALDLL